MTIREESASWLGSREREYLETEFRKDVAEREPPNREVFFRALFAPQVLLLTLIKLLMLSGQLGYLFWLPSALESAKHISHLEAGFALCRAVYGRRNRTCLAFGPFR